MNLILVKHQKSNSHFSVDFSAKVEHQTLLKVSKCQEDLLEVSNNLALLMREMLMLQLDRKNNMKVKTSTCNKINHPRMLLSNKKVRLIKRTNQAFSKMKSKKVHKGWLKDKQV